MHCQQTRTAFDILRTINKYNLLLRADVIVHENEVSIRRNEREDALRLPTLISHAWVETYIVKETGILLTKTFAQLGSLCSPTGKSDLSKSPLSRNRQRKCKIQTIKDKVRSGIPLSLTQASITPWISANTVEPKPNKLDGCQKVKGQSEFAFR